MADLNVSITTKGHDRYILLFDNAHKSAALRQLGKWACDSELNFSWYDAARMSWKIKVDRKNAN